VLQHISAKKWISGCFVGGLALFATHISASAQMTSTNCMVTGNMVNCTSIGDGGSGYQYDDGGEALGEGIGKLIASIGEKNFRKKIGKMLADGDCQSASRYAYEKGRLELGSSIAQACRPATPPVASTISSAQVAISPADLESALIRVAHNAKTPMEIFEQTTVSKVQAVGSQLVMTALVDRKGATITENGRNRILRDICESSAPLLQAGASVRIDFFERSAAKPRAFDTVIATRQECGV